MKSVGGDSAKVRKINADIILDALKAAGGSTLSELAAKTGLSHATCSNIVAELLAAKSVVQLDDLVSRGGRPARRFAYNASHTLVACIMAKLENNKEKFVYAVADAMGSLVEKGMQKHRHITMDELHSLAAGLVKKHPAVKAVAVSIPGVVQNGVISICDLTGLAGQRVEEELEQIGDIMVIAENDMNFAALGFMNTPIGKNFAGLAYMVFPADACPGSGIVVNGMLVKGKSNFAGEISFAAHETNRAVQLKNLADREWVIDYVAKCVCRVTAVINPDGVVLTGSAVDKTMLETVYAACLEHIPSQHLPEIIIKPNYDQDCLGGMIALGLDSLTSGFQLVQKERSWWVNE